MLDSRSDKRRWRMAARCALVVLVLGGASTGPGPSSRALAAANDAERAPAPGSFRIPESIPVRRDTPAGTEHHAPVRVLLVVAVLGVGAIVVLRRYRPAPASSSRVGGDGVARWARWLAPKARPDDVRLMSSVRLTPRATVHVLRWDGRELLVGCAENGVTLIAQRTVAPDTEKPSTEGAEAES